MTGTPPILTYSKPARSGGAANGLRIIAAATCAFTALLGIGILLVGVNWFGTAAFIDMPAIDRRPMFIQAGVIIAIGLVMTGFSLRWCLAAVRAVRRARAEVEPAAADQIITR